MGVPSPQGEPWLRLHHAKMPLGLPVVWSNEATTQPGLADGFIEHEGIPPFLGRGTRTNPELHMIEDGQPQRWVRSLRGGSPESTLHPYRTATSGT
jgi:hypothetical protein